MAEKKTDEKVKLAVDEFKDKRAADIKAVKAIKRMMRLTILLHGPGQHCNDLLAEQLAKIEIISSTLTNEEIVDLLNEEDEQTEYEQTVYEQI